MYWMRTQAVAGALALTLLASLGRAQDAARAVSNGGIFVPGWQGKIDANEERAGQKLENARFAREGDAFHVTTGPAAVCA